MSYTHKNNQPILKSIYYNVNLDEKYNVMLKDIVKIMFNLINAFKKKKEFLYHSTGAY